MSVVIGKCISCVHNTEEDNLFCSKCIDNNQYEYRNDNLTGNKAVCNTYSKSGSIECASCPLMDTDLEKLTKEMVADSISNHDNWVELTVDPIIEDICSAYRQDYRIKVIFIAKHSKVQYSTCTINWLTYNPYKNEFVTHYVLETYQPNSVVVVSTAEFSAVDILAINKNIINKTLDITIVI